MQFGRRVQVGFSHKVSNKIPDCIDALVVIFRRVDTQYKANESRETLDLFLTSHRHPQEASQGLPLDSPLSHSPGMSFFFLIRDRKKNVQTIQKKKMFPFGNLSLAKYPTTEIRSRKTILFEHWKQRHDFYELVLRRRRRMFERFRRGVYSDSCANCTILERTTFSTHTASQKIIVSLLTPFFYHSAVSTLVGSQIKLHDHTLFISSSEEESEVGEMQQVSSKGAARSAQ